MAYKLASSDILSAGSDPSLMHVGRSKADGAPVGSGRYPLGSGANPYQKSNRRFRDKGVEAGRKVKTAAKNVLDSRRQKAAERKAEKSAAQAEGKSVRSYRRGEAKKEKLRKEALETHDPRKLAKGMTYLTDAELQARITRLTKEQQVRNLASKFPPSTIDRVKKEVLTLAMDTVVKPALQEKVKPAVAGALGKVVDKSSGSLEKLSESLAKKSGKDPEASVANAEAVAESLSETTVSGFSRDNPRYTSRYKKAGSGRFGAKVKQGRKQPGK